MEKCSFEDFLRVWLDRVNDVNSKQEEDEKIILDLRCFDYCECNDKYKIKNEGIENLLKADFCLIGDNPGTLEKENKKYFYHEEDNCKKCDGKRAGEKVFKIVSHFSEKQFIYFNKALISTSSTKNISSKEINVTADLVRCFLIHLCIFNKKVKFVFFGVNKKFKKFFNGFKFPLKRTCLYYHPCSSKYNEATMINILKETEKSPISFADKGFNIVDVDYVDDCCGGLDGHGFRNNNPVTPPSSISNQRIFECKAKTNTVN